MPSPLDVARAKAARLEAELKQIQSFIQMYEAFSTGLETVKEQNMFVANAKNSSSTIHKEESSVAPHVALRRRSGPAPRELVEMAERMIRDAGRPLSRGDLVEMFDARDVELPGTDKPRYIGTIMWRNKSRFLQIEGRGYWLRGEPVPKKPSAEELGL